MNSFGMRLRVQTFGESHGVGIGCVIDGVPAGLVIDEEFIAQEMRLRQGGGVYATPRREADSVEILSGVFEGKSTGACIALFIRNTANKSADYEEIKDIFRPGHADFTYFQKYGIRDYRGGGRSSARESAVRVASGAIAKLLLKEFGISVGGGILGIGGVVSSRTDFSNQECAQALDSQIFALDTSLEQAQKEVIKAARAKGDSVGGVALLKAFGVPIGLGEPLYGKLDSQIGALMLGLNGVKAVEIGEGVRASGMLGSAHNDCMDTQGFLSNHSGGMLGGISTGEEICVRVHFKPTPSIFIAQDTQDIQGRGVKAVIKGRHDPCIAVRGSIVAQSQLALILADLLLCNASATLRNLKNLYVPKRF
ncbi:chorismate synthase [Helicobacter sp. 10-6591]|uniref:chorismate synthase n=1 Tax=Helicobacter sp. 10-6591 TaxID=2004998 RepID=UPI000DCE26AC|nr:chorismate synthase [Helicobacter sp. 10-6591]MCI7484851.1 chorismate synthase [Helicobacter sp.]RAX55009.1 chorismate synthase [Helicobacter sp. 10-6591]